MKVRLSFLTLLFYFSSVNSGLNKTLCTGRTVQVRLSNSGHYSTFLRLAVEAGFDWVFYEANNLVRLSVIPTSKLMQQLYM